MSDLGAPATRGGPGPRRTAMLVIHCHPGDTGALWLRRTLIALGIDGVELVAVEHLVFSRRIVHWLRNTGDLGVVELADGRAIRPDTITGLINRVQYLPTQHFASADSDDRAYAIAELHAFMLAWLNGVAGRVINPARPLALGGGTPQRTAVLHFAAMAGLPTMTEIASTRETDDRSIPSSLAPTHTVVVLDGRVFGSLLPRHLQDGCRRLATLLGMPLLQVFLHQSPTNGWRFVGITGMVDFLIGGRPLAASIARALAA